MQNQREIKFRAKVKRDAGVYQVEAINWLDQVIYLDGARHSEATPFSKIQALIQSVGITDKNKKDVYEGDILTKEGLFINGAPMRHVVEWEHDTLYYGEEHDSALQEHVGFVFNEHVEELEVIGNIHWNPELEIP